MKRITILSKALIAILLCGYSLSASARNCYLSSSGNDNNNGTSFVNAFATFSKALATVENGESIYVRGMISMADDPANTEVDDYTGYTKLGLNIGKNITIQGESKETSGFIGENASYDVTRFFRVGENITLKLKELTLTKAVCVNRGAAVLVSGGKLIGENLIFSENEAEIGWDPSMGAAIHVDATTGISLTNCVFYKNKAQKGPGIYIADVKNQFVEINLESCSFIENTATGSPTAGAIFVRMIDGSENNTINLINCTVAKNKASANGGAIHVYGAPASNKISFINCTIAYNENSGGSSGDRGGGIVIGEPIGASGGDRCKVFIQNCIIEGNSNATIGEPTTYQASDLTCAYAPTLESVQMSNSYIGRATTINGGAIPAGCYVSCQNGYMSSSFNQAQMKAGLSNFDAERFVYPLKEGADALAFGNSAFLDEAGIFNDAIGRARAFEGNKCSAGAMEGVGLNGYVSPTPEIIPPEAPIVNAIPFVRLTDIQVYREGNLLVVKGNKAVSLELLSVSGLLIAKESDNAGALAIPVNNLQGAYIARVITGGQVYSQKVVF